MEEFQILSPDWNKTEQIRNKLQQLAVKDYDKHWHGPFSMHDVARTVDRGVEWPDIVMSRLCIHVGDLFDDPPFIEPSVSSYQMIDLEGNEISLYHINKRMDLGKDHDVRGWGEILAEGDDVFVPYRLFGMWMAGYLYRGAGADGGFRVRVYNGHAGNMYIL
jgi:hypothetical protein